MQIKLVKLRCKIVLDQGEFKSNDWSPKKKSKQTQAHRTEGHVKTEAGFGVIMSTRQGTPNIDSNQQK